MALEQKNMVKVAFCRIAKIRGDGLRTNVFGEGSNGTNKKDQDGIGTNKTDQGGIRTNKYGNGCILPNLPKMIGWVYGSYFSLTSLDHKWAEGGWGVPPMETRFFNPPPRGGTNDYN